MTNSGSEPEVPIHEIEIIGIQRTDIVDHRSPYERRGLRNRVFTREDERPVVKLPARCRAPFRRAVRLGEERVSEYDPDIRMPLEIVHGLGDRPRQECVVRV